MADHVGVIDLLFDLFPIDQCVTKHLSGVVLEDTRGEVLGHVLNPLVLCVLVIDLCQWLALRYLSAPARSIKRDE